MIQHSIKNGVCTCGNPDCSSPGKHPYGSLAPNGVYSATTDPETIKLWWKKFPKGNVGVRTGKDAGMFALDVDVRNGGDEELKRLVDEHGPLPETVTVRSGGGGVHYFFKYPAHSIKNSLSTIGPGLDIKRDGGCITTVSSMHISGKRYEWEEGKGPDDVPLAESPAWLLDLMKKCSKGPAAFLVEKNSQRVVRKGMRNEVFAKIGGYLRHLGFVQDAIRGALRAFNKTLCESPLPDTEVDAIAKSVSKYPRGTSLSASTPAPFPIHIFPPALAEFIMTACTAMGCDIAMMAPHLLAVASAAIGNTRVIKLKESWCEPAVIWVCIVAESGTLKSPALALVLEPIQEKQSQAHLVYQVKLAEWKDDEGSPDRGPAPIMERYLAGDVTIEALVAILNHAVRGVLLARDELAAWMKGFDVYKSGKGGDLQYWLEIHRANQIIVDRKSTETPCVVIDRAYVSVCGSIQPGILRRVLNQEHRESGLGARLLLVMPKRRPKRWNDTDVTPEDLKKYRRSMRRLYTLKPGDPTDKDPYPPVALPLSDAAHKLWVEFYNEHNAEAATMSGDLAAAWSKLEGYAARFALIIEHLNWAFGPHKRTKKKRADAPPPTRISEDSMRSAIELTRWFCGEARRIYAMIDHEDLVHEVEQLIQIIQSAGGSITARELVRKNNRYRNIAELKLDLLAQLGHCKKQSRAPGKKGGRPTVEYVLN